MIGIGKSTPTIKTSPSSNIGRKERIFVFAADAALSIAFLSCSLISYGPQKFPFGLIYITRYLGSNT
ncbi:hypothetical protein [Xylanibacter muris]|uniref:hypothetical protein n=1 Tax=Xylanibacter muris TaxID=2736290 RepID=UPI001552F009|nr:hypothetical protein [Xylanibacter muris]